MATSKTIGALFGPTLIASPASIFINLEARPTMVDQAFHATPRTWPIDLNSGHEVRSGSITLN
jgi:hypothetical protein